MTALQTLYGRVADILRDYSDRLDVKTDTASQVYVDTRHIMPNGKPMFFGSVQLRKDKVSFHLMPVYVEPNLLEGVSPALKKRMSGKSCFNLKATDTALIDELDALVKAGFASFARAGYVD